MIKSITKRRILKVVLIAAFTIGSKSVQAQFEKKQDIIQFTNGRWGVMTATVNGKIYAGGGYVGNSAMNDWQEYDPVTNKWTPKTNYMAGGSVANRSAGITFVVNNKLYLGLGAEHFLSFTLPVKQLADLWSYDPATDKWTQHASLPDSGRNSSAVFVVNNKAYVVGGETSSTGSKTNDVWEYDPATDKWTSKPAYPGGAFRNAAAFAISNKGYVTGGSGAFQSTALKSTYEFDGSNWKPKADFPSDSGRQGAVAFVVNNIAYVGLGGRYGDYPTSFFTYNPATDSWSFLTGKWPSQGRMFGRAEVIGTKAYIGMGWRLDGSTQTFFKDWYETDAVGLLGIEDVQTNTGKISVYPNPTSGMVHVATEAVHGDMTFSLYGIDGKQLHSGKLPENKTLDITNYPAGQYILNISSKNLETSTIVELQW